MKTVFFQLKQNRPYLETDFLKRSAKKTIEHFRRNTSIVNIYLKTDRPSNGFRSAVCEGPSRPISSFRTESANLRTFAKVIRPLFVAHTLQAEVDEFLIAPNPPTRPDGNVYSLRLLYLFFFSGHINLFQPEGRDALTLAGYEIVRSSAAR